MGANITILITQHNMKTRVIFYVEEAKKLRNNHKIDYEYLIST